MTYGFVAHSTELMLTPNGDGTHSLRVVQAAAALEFTCKMQPHLLVRVKIDDGPDNFQAHTWSGKKVELRVEGWIEPTEDGRNWHIQALSHDDSGVATTVEGEESEVKE